MTDNDTNNSSQVPLLTFNSLYGLLREEKKVRDLQTLPEKFYEGVKTFLNSKKVEIKKLKENKETEKLSKEMRVYKNSKQIVEELVVLRLSKISSVAIRSGFHGDENTISKQTLKRESEFFESVVKNSKDLKEVLV